MRVSTKGQRLESRQYQFDSLTAAGYIQETCKGLDFFSKDDGQYFTLKVYQGTAANHIEYTNYRTAERRAEAIANFKARYDRNEVWKAEIKEKNKGKSSGHAACAAAVKAELTAKFPGIKFSCKSDSFSGGDSVHISWTDGPAVKEVEAISAKYQYGHFNGMEDIYESTNSRDDIPQAKYVSESRSTSEAVNAALPAFVAMFPADKEYNWNDTPEQIFRRIIYKTSFPAEFTNLQIIRTDLTSCIGFEDFYQFTFTDQTQPAKVSEAPQYKPVESKEGEINIIDYSEKAFAVVGDTKPIKDKLSELGGSFNARLTCGPGWIFSKKKLDAVTKALSEESPEPTPPEETTVKSEVAAMIGTLADIDRKIYGEVSEGTREAARVQNVVLPLYNDSDTPQHYNSLPDIEAAANGGRVISLFNLCQLVNQ